MDKSRRVGTAPGPDDLQQFRELWQEALQGCKNSSWKMRMIRPETIYNGLKHVSNNIDSLD